jgi:hypothetical protein
MIKPFLFVFNDLNPNTSSYINNIPSSQIIVNENSYYLHKEEDRVQNLLYSYWHEIIK